MPLGELTMVSNIALAESWPARWADSALAAKNVWQSPQIAAVASRPSPSAGPRVS